VTNLGGFTEADVLRSELARQQAAMQLMQAQAQAAVQAAEQFKSLAMTMIVALGTGENGIFTGEVSEELLVTLPQEYFLEQQHNRKTGALRLSVITPASGAVFVEIKKKHEEAQRQQLEKLEQMGLTPKQGVIV
jgi:hypothetical protein